MTDHDAQARALMDQFTLVSADDFEFKAALAQALREAEARGLWRMSIIFDTWAEGMWKDDEVLFQAALHCAEACRQEARRVRKVVDDRL